jgi:tetratricopeptide (TPR) repeat protein
MLDRIGTEAVIRKLQDRRNPRWSIQLANVYLSSRKWQDGANLMEKLFADDLLSIKNEDQRLFVLQNGGQIYAAAAQGGVPGAYDKAIAVSKRYLAELERRRMPASVQMDALNNLAALISEHPQKPNPAEALPYAKMAYDIMGQSTQFQPTVADTYGWVLVLAGRVDEGLDVLRIVVIKENAPPDAFYHLGMVYLKKKNYDDAEIDLKKAVELAEKYRKANVLLDTSLEGKAKKALEEATAGKAAAKPKK